MVKEQYYWLSFCNIKKSEGQQFLGAIITKAISVAEAIAKTREWKINPGGEIKFVQLSLDIREEIDASDFDKLLSKEESLRYKRILERENRGKKHE